MATLFDEVLAEVMVNIRHYAASLVRSERADDVAQEAYYILIKDRAEYEKTITTRDEMVVRLTGAGVQSCKYVHWGMRRRAHMKDSSISQGDRERPDTSIQLPDEAYEAQENQRRIREAAGKLSGNCGEIIRKKLANFTTREIWEQLKPDATFATFSVQVNRCVAQLKEILVGGDQGTAKKGGKS